MKDEDSLNYLIQWLRNPPRSQYSSYGYDVYIPHVIAAYLQAHENIRDPHRDAYNRMVGLSPHFYSAAWELCRRGIIRPGVHKMGAQVTDQGSGGDGYSITPFGRAWLAESDRDDFVPTEPGRFGAMLKPFEARFGSGFYSRAQEAVRCYGAHAYLGCCAMCGAAAESIFLAIAIRKNNNEEQVLKAYTSAGGRNKIENLIIGQAKEGLQREFRGFTALLKYWRDEAAHGRASGISDNEALTSLALLLRFAQFADEQWDELTGSAP